MTWSLWGVPGTLTCLVAWAAAVVVLRTSPGRTVNRRLAGLLFLEGIFLATSVGAIFFVESRTVVGVLSVVSMASLVAVSHQYLAFLGISLQTPLVAPFRSKRAFWILMALGGAAVATVVAQPGAFVSEPYAPGWAPWNFQFVGLGESVTQLHGLVFLYGFLAAVTAYFQVDCCDSNRKKAFWFAAAFGVRDVYAGLTQLLYPVLRPAEFWGDLVYNPGLAVAYLAYVILMSYGVLQAQLFDIDVRIRGVLQRSTVVAVIAGVFFVGSEILEALLPVDDAVLGVVMAGVIVLLLRPLQSVAERVAARIVPGSPASEDALDARKVDVYRAALEGALQDGVVTEREQEVLRRLRRELEISEAEAARIQREMAVEAA